MDEECFRIQHVEKTTHLDANLGQANTNLYDDHGLESEQGQQQFEHQERHCSSQELCLYTLLRKLFHKKPKI